MSIGWPVAFIAVFLIIGLVAVISTIYAARAAVEGEQVKGKHEEEYRALAATYETLARETREVQAAMQADVATLREKIDSIEKMMREVG